MSKNLVDIIQTRKQVYLDDDNQSKLDLPKFITENLKYPLFDWQKDALENFLIFERTSKFSDYPIIKERPTHLLFNMATGAGKTLVMAALILYYYQQGYRHFLFFVNQNNIIDKTENNFIDNAHAKFLFKPKIMQGDTVVPIQKVETFSPTPNGIEIKFTTIQKLYNDIHIEKENQTTLADLNRLNLVMLGDEAHHFNAQTKKGKNLPFDFDCDLSDRASAEEIERKGWEYMVLQHLLNRNGLALDQNMKKNVLLEFTATLPDNIDVHEKYADKLITKFTLKEFLQQGYTKEINLISSTLNKKERILHALLFAWYRHQVALKYHLANFKPVMLFRSRTINDSKADFSEFLQLINTLSIDDFAFLEKVNSNVIEKESPYEQGKTRTEQALKFMSDNDLSFSHLVTWIQQNYREYNVIMTNSETNKTKKEKTDSAIEKLLNDLEAENNPIRAIFTVDRLTEGWDVLNLFDIVRLYEGTNAGGHSRSSGKTPSATVAEKQLIGRGVRYFPFAFDDKPVNKRKFDHNLNHDLRILEELFYYTHDEKSRYISELKTELRKDGFLPEDDKILVTLNMKSKFSDDPKFQNKLIWANKKIKNPNAKQHNSVSLQNNPSLISYRVQHNYAIQEMHFKMDDQDEYTRQIGQTGSFTQILNISQIERHIFNKALHIKGKNEQSLFHFNRLQEKLGIQHRSELQMYLLRDWKIEFLGLDGDKYIHPSDKLQACLMLLDKVEQHLISCDTPFIGSKTFSAETLGNIFAKPKQKRVKKEQINNKFADQYDWYVMDKFVGTSLEQDLITFIADQVDNLQQRYNVHLIRNEEILKLNHFDDGEGFMPDFILLLQEKEHRVVSGVSDLIQYQIFIEPKGEHLVEKDKWKQDFLNAITDEYGQDKIIQQETPHYRLIGLPFFRDAGTNATLNNDFKAQFSKILP